jgi:hypothetical protein
MTIVEIAGDRRLKHLGINLTQLHSELWRVTRPEGEVLGYIEQFTVRDGQKFRAKRFLARQRRFIVMGEFWSVDDAIECFRIG